MADWNVTSVLACAASAALLWKPTIVVLFPWLLYTSDLTSVFLINACIGSSSKTVFVFCLLEVLVACVLLDNYVIPSLFGRDRWSSFDRLKQRKLVGFVIKILVRIACFVQVMLLVVPMFELRYGLFNSFNIKSANEVLVHEGRTVTCAASGMNLRDASAIRSWAVARDDMMAVMVWELAFIPELPVDAWLHHLFVVLGVALGSDPQLLGARPEMQPLVDGVALFLLLGASLAAAVEGAVLMYHLSAPDAAKQARWMTRSLLVQGVIVVIFFLALPGSMVVGHAHRLGWLSLGLLLLVLLLSAVEVRMMLVKRIIVQKARAKMLRSTSVHEVPRQASFHHSVDAEAQRLEEADRATGLELPGPLAPVEAGHSLTEAPLVQD